MPRRRARLRVRPRPVPASPVPRGHRAWLPHRVRELLRLGEPAAHHESTDPWLDYPTRFRLGPDDVPDLLRLVTDPTLRVSDNRSTRGFGRVHAARALAQLAAGGVTAAAAVAQPLLDLCLQHTDEWLYDDGIHELALVGRPSLPLLRAVVDDPDAEWLSLSLALWALAEMGVAHPSTRAEVLDILLAELQYEIERAEDLPLWDDDDSAERNMHACPIIHGFLDMDAGRGPRGPEVLATVRRAFANRVIGDWVFGPWPEVRRALQTGAELET
jgi:hypothetical protein